MKNETKKYLYYLLLIFIFLGLFSVTSAEFSLSDIKTNIIVSPENPKSNQNISLTISSPADLNVAEITWSLDNKIVLKGVGEKILRFKTGSVGNNNKVGIVIKTLDGNIIYKDIEIRPADVDMLWEALTYTPPFYKGKALNAVNSVIKVVAVPYVANSEGAKISPKNLFYEWKIKDEVRPEISGIGKNTYTFQTDIIPVKDTIAVDIKLPDGTSVAGGSLTLIGISPEIVIYENNPVLGTLFNVSFKNAKIYNNETMLSAYPFFFSINKNREEMNYLWKVNERMVSSSDSSVVFTKPEESGASKIYVQARGFRSPYQKNEVGFYVSF